MLLRRLLKLAILNVAAAITLLAAGWPDQIYKGKLEGVSKGVPEGSRHVWDEYGLDVMEVAKYNGFTITAWRFKDPTGAYAAFEWQSGLAPKADIRQFGNFVFRFEGIKPTADDMRQIVGFLPRLQEGQLPNLDQFLPKDGRTPKSERYILGPASLDAFFPKLPPSAAGFFLGAEAQMAGYPAGTLIVFNYPTPQLARERHVEFMKLPGVMAKRSGPLVAILLEPKSADDAERLLAKVNYQAQITWAEKPATPKDNIGNLIVNAFVLIGILLALAMILGLGFGGIRALVTGRKQEEADPMIRLHIDR